MPHNKQKSSLDSVTEIIGDWAKEQRLVGRIWVFGSRARSEERPDSDVDIAIELDLSASKGSDESGGFATWSFDCRSWATELQERLPFKVDVQQFIGAKTPVIRDALNRSSVLAYKKDGFRGKPVKIRKSPNHR